jgi:hypothetical protein
MTEVGRNTRAAEQGGGRGRGGISTAMLIMALARALPCASWVTTGDR